MNNQVTVPVTIVIPTKNEEKILPRLLTSINEQTYPPSEVIVSDAFSTDRTREIARENGAKVVGGGIVSVGRNNGAKAAESELLFFMDADAKLPDKLFLKRVYDKFNKSGADIGSTLFKIDEESKKYPVALFFYNSYVLLKFISGLSRKPFIESGLFLITTKEAFNKIGGFKEIKHGIPEDLEYMLHGINLGLKYKVLNIRIIGCARRYHNIFFSVKTFIGAILCGWVVKFNLYDKERFVDLSSRMYGELGGDADKERKDKILAMREKMWDSKLVDTGRKLKVARVATIVTAVVGSIAGLGLIARAVSSPKRGGRE